jgi:hypothetical protein
MLLISPSIATAVIYEKNTDSYMIENTNEIEVEAGSFGNANCLVIVFGHCPPGGIQGDPMFAFVYSDLSYYMDSGFCWTGGIWGIHYCFGVNHCADFGLCMALVIGGFGNPEKGSNILIIALTETILVQYGSNQ